MTNAQETSAVRKTWPPVRSTFSGHGPGGDKVRLMRRVVETSRIILHHVTHSNNHWMMSWRMMMKGLGR